MEMSGFDFLSSLNPTISQDQVTPANTPVTGGNFVPNNNSNDWFSLANTSTPTNTPITGGNFDLLSNLPSSSPVNNEIHQPSIAVTSHTIVSGFDILPQQQTSPTVNTPSTSANNDPFAIFAIKPAEETVQSKPNEQQTLLLTQPAIPARVTPPQDISPISSKFSTIHETHLDISQQIPKGSEIDASTQKKNDEEDEDEEENEDLFEKLFEVGQSLERKLLAMDAYDPVAPEMKKLMELLRALESQQQQREEDSSSFLSSLNQPGNSSAVVSTVDYAKSPDKSSYESKIQSFQIQSAHKIRPLESYTRPELALIVKMQRLFRNSRTNTTLPTKPSLYTLISFYRSHPDADAIQRIKRHRVIRDIIKTERVYVRNLKRYVESFLDPLEHMLELAQHQGATCKIINREQFNAIFMNVRALCNTNEILLRQIQQAYHLWPQKSFYLSEIFAQTTAPLKQYAHYVSNYPAHLTTLVTLKRSNKAFSQWLKSVQKATNIYSFDISDVSITPVTRLPRYVVYLERYLQFLDPDTNEYVSMAATLLQIKQLADQLAEGRKVSENLKVVYKIQTQISGAQMPNLLDTPRAFLHEGNVMKLTDRIHRRQMYLFSDSLLFTKKSWKPGDRQSVFDDLIPLTGATIIDDVDLHRSFRIIYHDGKSSITLLTDTDEGKAVWMRNITNALADHLSQLTSAQIRIRTSQSLDHLQSSAQLPSKQGFLFKMEGGFIKFWKSRWIKISNGVLYTFVSNLDLVPLRSYDLKQFIIKQMYLTDNFTRYCIHLIQLHGGKRQIILSAYSKTALEQWLAVLKVYVDLTNSTALKSRRPTSISTTTPAPPPSSESVPFQSVSLIEDINLESPDATGGRNMFLGERVFPEEVSNQFISTVQQKQQQHYPLFMSADPDNSSIIIEMDSTPSRPQQREDQRGSRNNSTSDLNKLFGNTDTTPQRNTVSDATTTTTTATTTPTRVGLINPLATPPVAGPGAPQGDKREVNSNLWNNSQSTNNSLASFQAKFQLSQEEKPRMFFTMASGNYIFLTKNYVCVESMFGKNQAVKYLEIIGLHKSKAGLLGSTGGKIMLQHHNVIELSGLLKRKDCFDAIRLRAKALHHEIPVYREGFGREM